MHARGGWSSSISSRAASRPFRPRPPAIWGVDRRHTPRHISAVALRQSRPPSPIAHRPPHMANPASPAPPPCTSAPIPPPPDDPSSPPLHLLPPACHAHAPPCYLMYRAKEAYPVRREGHDSHHPRRRHDVLHCHAPQRGERAAPRRALPVAAGAGEDRRLILPGAASQATSAACALRASCGNPSSPRSACRTMRHWTTQRRSWAAARCTTAVDRRGPFGEE